MPFSLFCWFSCILSVQHFVHEQPQCIPYPTVKDKGSEPYKHVKLQFCIFCVLQINWQYLNTGGNIKRIFVIQGNTSTIPSVAGWSV